MAHPAGRKGRMRVHKNPIPITEGGVGKLKPPESEKDFLDILIRHVVNATTFENRANEEFNAAMNQFPTGLPYPNGAQQIKTTSAHLLSARKMLEIARNRLDDFINKGSVPEDLKRSG